MKAKRSLSMLLSILFAVSLLPGLALPVRAMEAVASGTCGEGLAWYLLSNGTLDIDIQGPEDEFGYDAFWMNDYSEKERAPWYSYRASILSVRGGEGVLSLGEWAFNGCSSLETVSLPDSLEYVGREVFRGCDSLSEIEVSSGNDYFYSDGGVLLGENCLYRYPPAKTDKYYCLPEDTYGSIWAGAFAGAKHLERLYIPEISDISFPVFAGCDSLTKLYLGGDAEYMAGWEEDLRADLPGENVSIFYNVTAEDCKNSVNGNSCGENVTWHVENGTLTISGTGPMEDYVRFDTEDDSWWLWGAPWEDWNPAGDPEENLSKITRVVVEEGVTAVGGGAFKDMICLETVELPSTLTALGVYAFNGDTALEQVVIPDGVAAISDSAFADSGLKEIVLPASVTAIGDSAFMGTKLEKIDLPAGLTSIGGFAFLGTPLKKVELPASVTSIGERAFYECLSLAEFAVDEVNPAYQSIGGALFSKDGTEMISYGAGHTAASYTVPDGVKKLHPSAFSYTAALEEIQLPDSLDEIDNWAFGHTGLKHVTVPIHVTTIQFNAFGVCKNLVSVTLPARLKTLEDWAFGGSDALKDIYFEGTEAQWAALTEGHEETLEGVTVHYRYDAYCAHENLVHHPAVPHGCLADGTIEYWECEDCGGRFADQAAKTWLDDVTDPAGHDYRSAVTLAPSCSEAGVRTWTCVVCGEDTEGHSYTEAIPATGRHHFVDGYCDNLLQDGVTVCGAPEQIAGGEVEGGFTWDIDSGGMLHIRGNGPLPDISVINLGNNSFRTEAPWWDYRNTITAVRIHSGVTSLGNGCFAGLGKMQSLYVPVTMTDMSKFWTFFQCNDLSDVYYEGTREQWSDVYLFGDSPAGNLISIANPFGSGMLKVVDYIGRTDKHFEFDPDLTYTVTWQNWDGAVLETDEGVFPGEEAEYNGETPVKAGNAQYTYTFDGWTPEPAAVTEDTVFTARFRQTINTYTVTWRNEDGTELQSAPAEYGSIPAYTGETPVKAATAEYTYTFDGWTPEITAVTGDAVYTAVFKEEAVVYEDDAEITDVSIEGSTEQQPIPAGSVSLDVTVRLDENTEPETVRVMVASYTADGRFISCSAGTLTKEADGTYFSDVDTQNSGDTDHLHILVLTEDGWRPLAEAVEVK